ncbi:MAG: DUF2148 domain-containing protein [Opitutales bacterium]|nr:DUF2148 domain-containing protein [Opitutales bacterium]
MICNERENRERAILQAATEMMTAARTAPKGKGADVVEIATLTGTDLVPVAAKMRQIAEEKGFKFFLRDAICVEKADAVIFVGTREQAQGLNCEYCGAQRCDLRSAGTPCAINSIDVGIALGSACSKAADLRIDTRVVYSAGTAAQELGVLGDAKQVIAILMSIGSKNPFFDRPKPQ